MLWAPRSGSLSDLLGKSRSASYILGAVGEFGLDARQLCTLGVELGLKWKRLAQSSLVVAKPAGCIRYQPLLLLKIQLEALKDVLQPGNQAERGQVRLDGDFLALSALQDQGDPEGSGQGSMSLANQIEAAEAPDAPLPFRTRTLSKAQLREEESAGRPAVGDAPSLRFERESFASGRNAPRQVLADGGDPLLGSVPVVTGVPDLPADVELVVEMGGALPLQRAISVSRPAF